MEVKLGYDYVIVSTTAIVNIVIEVQRFDLQLNILDESGKKYLDDNSYTVCLSTRYYS